MPDPDTDIDETLGALTDLVRAGKIRSFGTSKVPASQVVEAQWAADRRGHGRFRAEQPPYSLLTRAIEYARLPACPPASATAYSPGTTTPRPVNAAKLGAADKLGALAGKAGLTLVQMAVAFAVRHPAVTSAIIGPRTMEHLDGYLAADGVSLAGDVLDRIDETVPPGVTVNVADNMWEIGTTALSAPARRRPAACPEKEQQ